MPLRNIRKVSVFSHKAAGEQGYLLILSNTSEGLIDLELLDLTFGNGVGSKMYLLIAVP